MRIVIITQDEPFYLAKNLSYLIKIFPEHSKIVGCVVADVSPFGKKESFLKKAKNWAEQHAHPVDTIEWLCQSVPTAAETELARDEIAKAVSGQSGQSGERKMESTSVKSGSATESSSSSSVLGSFRMSTKKKEMTGGDQSDRLCGSICQTQ